MLEILKLLKSFFVNTSTGDTFSSGLFINDPVVTISSISSELATIKGLIINKNMICLYLVITCCKRAHSTIN